jgi:hypothetical protein
MQELELSSKKIDLKTNLEIAGNHRLFFFADGGNFPENGFFTILLLIYSHNYYLSFG